MKQLARKIKNTIKDEIICITLWYTTGIAYDIPLGAFRKAQKELRQLEEEKKSNQKDKI